MLDNNVLQYYCTILLYNIAVTYYSTILKYYVAVQYYRKEKKKNLFNVSVQFYTTMLQHNVSVQYCSKYCCKMLQYKSIVQFCHLTLHLALSCFPRVLSVLYYRFNPPQAAHYTLHTKY